MKVRCWTDKSTTGRRGAFIFITTKRARRCTRTSKMRLAGRAGRTAKRCQSLARRVAETVWVAVHHIPPGGRGGGWRRLSTRAGIWQECTRIQDQARGRRTVPNAKRPPSETAAGSARQQAGGERTSTWVGQTAWSGPPVSRKRRGLVARQQTRRNEGKFVKHERCFRGLLRAER